MDCHGYRIPGGCGELMIRTGRKGGIFVSMIILLVIYLFAVAIVLVFFYFFKFHVTTTVLDEYRWNKIQEVPLDLLSMDIDGKSFVPKMNKVYYKFEPEDEFKKVRNIVNNQLYFMFGGDAKSMGYIISIGNATVSQSQYPNCGCMPHPLVENLYTCNDDCSVSKKGNYCGKYVFPVGIVPDPSLCFVIGRREYSASYPFPLTFNGTDEFTARLSYDAVEYV